MTLGITTRLHLSNRTMAVVTGLALATGAFSQAYTITEPSINACVGALLDSGGEGASGYSDNEDFTTTICADAPDLSISLNFSIFNLNTDGNAPIDQLVIYDGPDVSSPVIGVYQGSNSPGIVSASFANTSGCLTLQFTSNETGQGLFAASILCYTPCEPPTAVVTMSEAAPALICQGETVSFDATASFAAQGYNVVSYAWDFADGSDIDVTSGALVNHAFEEPGEYVVQIVITDDNECDNNNLIDLPVWVSTSPLFNLNDTSVCLGNEVPLWGDVDPVTWTALPNADFGEAIPLPDNVGQTFSTELTYTVFESGSTLQDINDLLGICVDMEHTFIGDLVIQIVCPNGQSVTLHEQGGGGMFVGDANDADDVDPDPGICWHYCWTPTATWGTWADVLHTVTASQGTSLEPGDYQSVNSLTGLLGCPLNGTWTFNITDNWSIDNGFICSWGMSFDPALYPDLTSFTPTLGLSTLDSAFWSGNDVILDPNDPTHAHINLTEPGTEVYTFSVTDNFGCTYTDQITVTGSGPLAQFTVSPSTTVPQGAPFTFTDQSIANGTTIVDWDWDFGPGLPGSGQQNPTVLIEEPGEHIVTLTVTGADGCTSTIQMSVLVAPADVVAPNVFSPNNDNQNDALTFTNAQYFNNNYLQVFNRWGNKVFESTNYKNTWKPNDLSEGTYYYIFRMQDGREWAGHVTLVRTLQ